MDHLLHTQALRAREMLCQEAINELNRRSQFEEVMAEIKQRAI
jgi:hypothetical protein